MGKIIRYDDTVTGGQEHHPVGGFVVTDKKEAERLHKLFTRPAKKPTPRMVQAIENYKRLKAMKWSDEYPPKP